MKGENAAMTTSTRVCCLFVLSCIMSVLAGACGAAVPTRPDEVVDLGPTRGERYAAALRQTIDAHEAEVAGAYRRTYPSFEVAFATSRRFSQADLTAILESRLQMQGLSLDGLNRYATEHPAWLREQNRIHRERMSTVRGTAFGIMTRFERGAGPTVAATVAAAPVVMVAGRKP